MNLKFENVYLNYTSIISGPYKGEYLKYIDRIYDDYYFNTPTFEDAEVKLVRDAVDILLSKAKLNYKDIDIHLSSNLTNQIASSSYASIDIPIPLVGIYGACSSSILGMIISSSMIDSKDVKNAIVSVSSHYLLAEKQFRYPSEYGAPKRKTATITLTASSACLLSYKKSDIKIESATIGKVIESGITDTYNMGAVMAPAAYDTLIKHLKYHGRDINYYDLVLTGDLGIYGLDILKKLLSDDGIYVNNLMDAGTLLKDKKYAGASGPVCMPLIAFGPILEKMKKKEYKKVLLIATGSLHNTSMCNEKKEIPAIAHLISLEAI